VSGDRVVLAARLYHSGKTRLLAATGERISQLTSKGPNPADETAEIWQGLGVPGGDILRLGGRNTSEEVTAVRDLMRQNQWTRVGLITSAWHMPRTMQLAARHRLDLQPLPTGFRGIPGRFTVLSLVPSPGGFASNQLALKEILGRAVGR